MKMKKIVSIIVIILIFGALAITNNKINKLENQNKNNEVLEVAATQEVKKEFKIVDTYITESGNTVIEFNDKTSVVINQDKNIFEFYPIECGDWEIKVNNHDNLINVIKSYMNNKYDMTYQEVENNSIFKNDILAYTPPTEEKEIIKPIAATQENKKVIKVTKEKTSNTIKNEVIEEPGTEEAEESQEQLQNGYTEEDYNKYLEYKESLIQEYGEEIYNLMNQEAGIETEEDSFNHFMEYGI